MPRFSAATLFTWAFLCLTAWPLPQASTEPTASTQAPQPPAAPDTKPLIDPKEPTVLGELQIVPINSRVLHSTRNLRVWLPANYHAPVNRNKRYPVLYMQDGQNLFDEATAFNHEWKFDETVEFLTGSMRIGPMIVVGIDNATDGHQRAIEYLPYPDNLNANSPSSDELRGKDYARFIVDEVMPFIQKRFRALTGAGATGIGGSSYGATISLYTALHYPGVFGKALIESPILELGEGQLLRDAETAASLPQKIYIGVGTGEGRDPEISLRLVKDVSELEKILREKKMGPNRLKVVMDEGGQHNEVSWSKRLQNALLFLYGSDIHLIPAK